MWRIAAHGDDWIRLETGSWYRTAPAVCLVGEAKVSLSLSLRSRPSGARVWSVVSGPHQRIVPVMREAVGLVSADRPGTC